MMINYLIRRKKLKLHYNGGDYKRKLDPNPHTKLVLDTNRRLGDVRLITILILYLNLNQKMRRLGLSHLSSF